MESTFMCVSFEVEINNRSYYGVFYNVLRDYKHL
jgi:hypothetical protein